MRIACRAPTVGHTLPLVGSARMAPRGTIASGEPSLKIRVVMAALDEVKARYGFKRFHLAGQSGGANTVAALVQMRDDIGCAVMAAGSISVKTNMRDKGIKNAARFSGYDPIDFVSAMQTRQAGA